MKYKWRKRIASGIIASVMSLGLISGGVDALDVFAATENGSSIIADNISEATNDEANYKEAKINLDTLTNDISPFYKTDSDEDVPVLRDNINGNEKTNFHVCANKTDGATITANTDGTYKLSWTYNLPKANGFYYSKNASARIVLCADVNTDDYTGNGFTAFDGADQHGGYIWLGAPRSSAATVVVKKVSEAKRDTIGWAGSDHHTYYRETLTETGYRNKNVFYLDTQAVTNQNFAETVDGKKWSATISAANMKKIRTWIKTFGSKAKNNNGKYRFRIAISYPPQCRAGWTHEGCGKHGAVWREVTGNAGNGISICNSDISGSKGALTTAGVNGVSLHKQDSDECQIFAYSNFLTVPDPPATTGEVDYVDLAESTAGSGVYDLDLGTEYDSKDYAIGSEAKPSDWGTAKTYNGYTYVKDSDPLKVTAEGGTVYRYYAVQKLSVSCVNIFRKNGTETSRNTEAATKTVYYNGSISGADWGTTAPANYTYGGCTSINPVTANGTVYRYFDLGGYSVVYHANGGTGADQTDTAYVGDKINLKGAIFTRTSDYGNGWELAGWSTSSGADNTVNYNLSAQNVDFGLAINGKVDLYAVWKPTLKITWNDGISYVTAMGTRFNKNDSISLAYNAAVSIKDAAGKCGIVVSRGNHIDDVVVNGTSSLTAYAEKIKNGQTIFNITVPTTIEIHTTTQAEHPRKKVVKTGTDTDVDKCLVSEGDRLTYKMSIRNDTKVPRDVTVTDVLDEGVDLVSKGDAAYDEQTRTLTWNFTAVPAGTAKEFSFDVVVNARKKGDSVQNYVTSVEKAIAQMGETEDLREISTTVINYVMETPEKHLRKTADSTGNIDNTILKEDDEAVYTVTVKNPSNDKNGKSFNISDVIPDELTPVSASDNGSIAGQTVTWSGISIPALSEKTVSVTVKAKKDLSGSAIVNSADVTCTDAYKTNITSNEVKNFSMKKPEKLVYETLDENRQIVDNSDETKLVSIDDQVIGDGGLITYRLKYRNPVDTERTLVVSDMIPEGTRIATSADLTKAQEGENLSHEYNFVEGGSYLITDGGILDEAGKITWTLPVEAETGGYVEFTVVVLDMAQDNYVRNTCDLTIQSPTGLDEGNPTLTSNEVKNPVLKTPDKIATRSDGQDVTELVVNDGEEITYKITFKNPADDTRDFTVTDIVPEFTELKEGTISDGGTYDAAENMITWQMPLDGHAEKTVSFTVLVKKEAQNKTVENTARVYVDRADKKTKEDIPTNIYILEDPKKAVINVDGDDINGIVKRAGDIITYNIIYKNPAEDERVATVTDVLPEDVEFIEAVHQGSYNVDTGKFEETTDKNFPASYDAATHTVTWTIPTAAKCQEMASVSVRILDSARNKVLKNTAEVYIPDAKKKTNEVVTPVADNPVKTAVDEKGQDLGGRLVTVGETFTYNIHFKNPAEKAKTGFITDTLPSGVDFVSADNNGKYDKTTHTVFWKNIEMEAGAELDVKVTVKVNETAKSQTIGNEAVYMVDEATVSTRLEDGGEGGPKMYVATKYVLDKKGEDIDGQVVCEGNTIVYKITYKNVTDSEKFYTILDVLPEGLKVKEVGDNGYIATAPLNGLSDYKLAKDRSVAWQFYLGPQEEGYVTVTAEVTDEKAGGILVNNAVFAVEDEADKTAPVFVKETNKVKNPVLKHPVKTVFNTDGREITDKMVAAGDEITYKITFKNPSDAVKTASIRDTLPKEVKFISCDYDGAYDEATHAVKWSDIDVKGGERLTVSCTVKVKESAGGKTVKNQGTVIMDEATITTRAKTPTSDPDDPEPSDKETTDNYVTAKKTYDAEGNDISGKIVKVGDAISYRIYFANTSATEKNYRITDVLPDEVDFVEATGNPDIDGKTLTWSTKLDPGKETYYEVKVTVNKNGYGKVIKNKANIVETDPKSGDDPYDKPTKETENPVFGKDDFVKAAVDKKGKNIDNAFVTAGSELNYLITLHNPAKDKTAKFVVTDKLPEEVKYVASTEGGVYDAEQHMVTWELELKGDATAKLEIATKVKKTVKSGTITNKAHVVTDSTEMDSNEVKNYVLENPVKAMFVGNKQLKDGEKVEANKSVTFTISYSNPTDKERELTVTDVLDKKIVDRVLSISDDGELADGVITWNIDVPAGGNGEVSFTVSSPDLNGNKVSNMATVSLDNEGLTGKSTLDTNTVYYICTPENTPDKNQTGGKDPGRQIVKTGDSIWPF